MAEKSEWEKERESATAPWYQAIALMMTVKSMSEEQAIVYVRELDPAPEVVASLARRAGEFLDRLVAAGKEADDEKP